LPTKIHAAFTWAAAAFPASPGIYKTDDDIIMQDISALVRQVLAHVATPYWGLRVGRCEAGKIAEDRIADRFTDTTLRPEHPAAHYGFGHGYWISRATLPLVLAAGDQYRAAFLEDVCTGSVLNAAGIAPLRLHLPYVEHPRMPEYLRIR
jgi:hypothetical protein